MEHERGCDVVRLDAGYSQLAAAVQSQYCESPNWFALLLSDRARMMLGTGTLRACMQEL